jgi:hypothetical protein
VQKRVATAARIIDELMVGVFLRLDLVKGKIFPFIVGSFKVSDIGYWNILAKTNASTEVTRRNQAVVFQMGREWF